MLDSDLANLYGISTGTLNQSVERNLDRFPEDFSFVLDGVETGVLHSSSSSKPLLHGGRRKAPRVFTELGVAMLSSVLNSPTAVSVNIEIMRTFVRLRRLLANPVDLADLVKQLEELTKTVQIHDDQIKVITDVIKKMLEHPLPVPNPRKIGFNPASNKGLKS